MKRSPIHSSRQTLLAEKVNFYERDDHRHFVVEGKHGYIDFWPLTEAWASRDGSKGLGINSLLAHVKGDNSAPTNL